MISWWVWLESEQTTFSGRRRLKRRNTMLAISERVGAWKQYVLCSENTQSMSKVSLRTNICLFFHVTHAVTALRCLASCLQWELNAFQCNSFHTSTQTLLPASWTGCSSLSLSHAYPLLIILYILLGSEGRSHFYQTFLVHLNIKSSFWNSHKIMRHALYLTFIYTLPFDMSSLILFLSTK